MHCSARRMTLKVPTECVHDLRGINQPGTAAVSVENIGAILRNAAESITSFFTRLVS